MFYPVPEPFYICIVCLQIKIYQDAMNELDPDPTSIRFLKQIREK